MKFNLKKLKTIVTVSSLLFISVLFTVFFQNNVSKANSILSPIIVNLLNLEFSVVFPGEQLHQNFLVSYSGDGSGIYTITEKYKPLPTAEVPVGYVGSISDYCQENYEDYTRCYKTLCPYMTEYSEEGEGDLINSASVGPNDSSDDWVVALSVPAIMGNVAQDHTGGIITENGAYGCDLSFDVERICENKPVDIVLIMDRSVSMGPTYDNPSRLSQAKTAANSFLGNLGSNDQSALVSYAGSASLDKGLSAIHITDPASTETAVNALSASGSTNIGDAIAKGTAEFSLGRENNQAVKVMILLTDGKPTCPVIHEGYSQCGYVQDPGDVDHAENMAILVKQAGIKVFTIGLGDNEKINEDMLQNIASLKSDGVTPEYYYAPNGSDLEGIYDEISGELCQ
ncbi:MAG: VWA domain-containing protein [Patescibacteria group bacterium]|nr:VWA domain-containing protein [Patescibacteria group bacterium]